ncbi:hypothetical protein SAMN04489742_1990 [Arthrobacter crystallopoietes]|uniref:Uncharacterized protein n=1 Tax=Crystallibacter crystallopoietes TaxID=37928 RepID=A0A1H1CMI4_9MICC|nr:hypothetical protein SAMN04489742_1990 [Arthrobacter crystallopoietes]
MHTGGGSSTGGPSGCARRRRWAVLHGKSCSTSPGLSATVLVSAGRADTGFITLPDRAPLERACFPKISQYFAICGPAVSVTRHPGRAGQVCAFRACPPYGLTDHGGISLPGRQSIAVGRVWIPQPQPAFLQRPTARRSGRAATALERPGLPSGARNQTHPQWTVSAELQPARTLSLCRHFAMTSSSASRRMALKLEVSAPAVREAGSDPNGRTSQHCPALRRAAACSGAHGLPTAVCCTAPPASVGSVESAHALPAIR